MPIKYAILVIAGLALAGCTTVEEDAANMCRGISNSNIRDNCMANYLNNAQVETNAEWQMIGAYMMSRGR